MKPSMGLRSGSAVERVPRVSEIEKVRTNKKDLMVAAVGPNVEKLYRQQTVQGASAATTVKGDPVGKFWACDCLVVEVWSC
jgi:hypothetical protein